MRILTLATTITTIQHLQCVCTNFRAVFFLSVLVRPFAGGQLAFDIDLAALAQIFGGNLSQAIAEHDAMPFGLFFALASDFIFPLFAGCQ